MCREIHQRSACTYSVDPVKFNRTVILESIGLRNSALALIFYTIAMVINLAMMPTEDYLRMSQYALNGTNQTYLTVVRTTSANASLLNSVFFCAFEERRRRQPSEPMETIDGSSNSIHHRWLVYCECACQKGPIKYNDQRHRKESFLRRFKNSTEHEVRSWRYHVCLMNVLTFPFHVV